MDGRTITPALRFAFLLNAIVAAIFGLQHLLAPRIWTDLAGIEITETVTWRGLGAALLGYAAGSYVAFKDRSWTVARTVLIMQIIWCATGALVIIWGLAVEGLPPLEWLNAILLSGFAVVFTILFRNNSPAN